MAMRTNYFIIKSFYFIFFFFQAEDGIRDGTVTGVQTCALPISAFNQRSRQRRRPKQHQHDQAENRYRMPQEAQSRRQVCVSVKLMRGSRAAYPRSASRLPEIGRASCRERV